MTDFWKSNPKRQCEFCKCWIADNKASIEFHEKGKNHQQNVKRRLAEVKKKAVEKRKADETFGKEFAAMEAAALKAVQKDLMNDPGILGANDLKVLVTDSNKAQDGSAASSADNSTTWITCQAPQGYTYYYNQKTGESRWDKPIELTEKDTSRDTEKHAKKDQDESKLESGSQRKEDSKHKEQMKTEESQKHPLLGGWTTVTADAEESSYAVEESDGQTAEVKEETEETSKNGDMPSTNPESHSAESRKRIAIFKEKQVKSLGDTNLEENVGFKKRKIKNNRSVRKRDNDED